jgi:two-component system cell cycle sensor histidine kinase/response regulator CckA
MDDDPHIRRLLTDMLAQLGYTSETASGGLEALEKYCHARDSAAPFDAAILDLTITGGMGGRQTAERLRRIDPSARLILSSGYSEDALIADYREHGFDEVLLKPWTPEELGETLHRVLGRPPAAGPP